MAITFYLGGTKNNEIHLWYVLTKSCSTSIDRLAYPAGRWVGQCLVSVWVKMLSFRRDVKSCDHTEFIVGKACPFSTTDLL